MEAAGSVRTSACCLVIRHRLHYSSLKKGINLGLVNEVQVTPNAQSEIDPMLQQAIRENGSKFPAKMLLVKPNLSPMPSYEALHKYS